MRRALIGFVAVLVAEFAIAEVKQVEDAWRLESQALEVTVKTESAWLSVRDKRTGTLWQQEDPVAAASDKDQVKVLRAATPPTIDGRGKEWSERPIIWLPWTGENGEKNCSGGARFMWDDERFYLYIEVRDDNVAFGGESTDRWWEADGVELWVGNTQVGLHLAPEGKEVACDPSGKALAGAEIAVRRITGGNLPGYAVELAMPLEHLPMLRGPQVGVRFRLAIGLNDADPKPGEPVKRNAQGYYPHSWVHSMPQTFAVAVLCDAAGEAPIRTRENDRSGMTGNGRVSDMKPGTTADTLTYGLEVTRGQRGTLQFTVTLALCQDGEALDITLTPAALDTPMRDLTYPGALYPDKAPGSYFLCVADYCDGRYVPVTDPLFRNRRLALSDLPFVAVTDGTQGLMLLALTPWNARGVSRTRTGDKTGYGFPAAVWAPVKGTVGEERRVRFHFFSQGGHVKACKLYRKVAVEDGYVRTVRQKAQANPNVEKLIGAVNWWGPRNGLGFVQEAKALGVRKGLLSKHTGISGRDGHDAIEEIKRLGWLNSEYDCYEDMDDAPESEISSHKGPLAKHGVIKADGEYQTAWVSRKKDMTITHTFMKRCTAVMQDTAKTTIPPLLAEYPHNARFIDVTTATWMKECYHPDHPLTRNQDVACRRSLLDYVANELKLVAGGEHGRFWSADILNYYEGMMGGGKYSWHAGHLWEPETREEIGEDYWKYGINPAARVPLYDLVFHDCVVDYCYWGATTDYLHEVAPDLTDRKVALNVLYGTPPIMWTHRNGLRWTNPDDREQMLAIYRTTCILHEQIGTEELISHEFLSPDRMVQRSRFADGTCSTVNFGSTPFTVRDRRGRELALLENDFYVVGPRIEEWRLTFSSGSEPARFVHADDALFVDADDDTVPDVEGVASTGKVWLGTDGPNRALIVLYPGATLSLEPGEWQPDWQGKLAATLLLDAKGKPLSRGPVSRGNVLALAAEDEICRYLLLVGPEAEKPDVDLVDVALLVDGQVLTEGRVPAPDADVVVRASVKNNGLAATGERALVLHLTGLDKPLCELRTPTIEPGNQCVLLSPPFKAGRADGLRRISVDIADPETCCLMGCAHAETPFRGPVQPDSFPFRRTLELTVPEGDAAGLVVERPFVVDNTVDVGNLRVAFPGGLAVPAQFEPSATAAAEGTLVLQLPAGLAPGTVHAEVLGCAKGGLAALPMSSGFAVAPDGLDVRLGTYSASLTGGLLKDVSVIARDGSGKLLISNINVSSKETGWSREAGVNEAFALEHCGPVRAVFYLRRKLNSGHLLERRFRFYADRFEIFSRLEPNVSMLTRTYFAMPGQAAKQGGGTVAMDGAGKSEGFGGGEPSSWYATYSPEFRFACIALTAPGGLIWWDSGSFGQCDIGYQGGGDWEKRLFVLSAEGARDAGFAEKIARAVLGRP